MAPKKKAGAGAGRGARGAGPSTVKPSSAADPGIDIVFDKPKPKSRGHRQRGAGTVMVDRGGIERDGITVLSWQRLPTQLVQQHADRMQAKRPQYHPVRASAGDLFRYRIVIPDRKNSSKDMAFCPTESFHTAAQAKEHAALLALLKLQEDQPLERKLPEPYKTTWLQSVAAMKGEDKRPLARWEKAKKVREEKEREEKEKAQAAVKAKASEAEASLGDSLWGASVEKEEEQKRKNEAIRRVTEGPAAVVLKVSSFDVCSPIVTFVVSVACGCRDSAIWSGEPEAAGGKADTKYVSKFEADKARAEKEKIIKDRRRKAEARARSNMDMKVMMSARIRRLLEEALGLAEERERHRDAGGEGPDDQGLTAESLEGADLAVFENVLAMGFPAYDVLRGLAACPRGDANESARERTDILLEWLCLHLEEEDLPKGFDPRGRNLDVIRAGQNFAAPAAAATAVANTNSTGVYSQRIGDRGVVEGGEGSVSVEGRLLRYGFGRNEVTRAIAEAAAAKEAKGVGEEEERGDSLDVRTLGPLEILARGLISSGLYSAVSGDKRRGGDKGGGDAEDGFPTEEEGREVVEEEVMSLEAIYDEAVTVAPSMPLGAYLLTFDLAKLASMPTEAWLDVWILQAGGIGGYPIEASPVCLVRGPKLSPQRLEAKRALLLPAQRALAGRASSLRGNPAIYDVLVWAIDELPSMLTFDAKGTPAVSAAVAGAGRTREAKPAKSAVAPVTVGEGGQGAGSTRAGGGDSGSGGRGRMVQPHLPGIEPLWDSGATRYEEGGSRGGDGSGVAGRWRRGGGSGSGVHRGRGGGGLERRRNQGRGKASTEEEKQHEGEREVVERPRPPQPVERSREFERKRRQREALPAAKARSEFLSMVRRSPVVLVSGETGCGKTTQIPQFLLEEWEESAACDGKDSDMRVLVTQPRRIAAVGVAQRVADERCEEVGAVGGVGYKIRGESRAGPGTRLLFCTTGLLLRRMQGDHLLKEVSHLVVDEVHERHLDADFLLALLLGILPKRPKLKVILMSATLDTARFAAYFARVPGLPGGKTPILHIPGRTFPVRELYLEDALAATGYRPRLRRGGKKNKTSEGQEDLASGGRGAEQGVEEEESQEEDDEDNENDGVQGEELSRLGGGGGGGFDMDQVDEDHLDYGLIASLVLFVVSPHGERYLGFRDDAREDGSGGNGSGSVLVFMPGTMEIDRLCRELEHSTEGGAQHLWVLPLHGSLPPQKQRAVFDPAPRGLRKVVVSTNIAETSITIPDVTVVVDSCRVKEMGYDVARQMPRLQESWASKDSLTQRKGRAGRVREGVSFRLIRRVTYRRLPEHGTPEIRRVPLDHLVLQIKALGVEEHPAVVLARALDPPDEEAVQDAVDGLTELKALGDGAELTPLGWHLAALPCPVQVGKMIIYGAVLGCLSPLLSIAAGLSCRSPFLSTGDPAKREEIDAAKKRMAAVGGGRSDHTLLAVAVTEWEASAAESGPGGRDRARKRFCSENGISFERMRELTEVRQQLAQALAGIGFIPSPRAAFDLRASVNAQAGSWRAVKAAACAGLYPRVVRVVRPMEKFVDLVGVGAVSVRHTAKEFHFFTRSRRREGGATGTATKDERVFIHPTSINFTTNDWSCPWLVYHERVHTSRVFVRDCTEVSPYAILLFGGKISVQAGLGRIAVDDGWVRFEAVGRIAALVNGLRQRLDGMLWEKIEDPRLDIAGSKLSRALVELLQTDGMG